jgi:hypothetical protein
VCVTRALGPRLTRLRLAGRPSVESGRDSGDGDGATDEDSDDSWVDGGEG